MRLELLWKPGMLCERIGWKARERRRLNKLRGTVAQGLSIGHIDSLELVEAVRPLGIRTIYDVGANVGTWVLLAKSIIPEAIVEAFEPLSYHCKKFRENTGHVNGVRLHEVALGSEQRSDRLRVTDLSDASSLLQLSDIGRTQWGIAEVSQVDVQVRRLDDYRRELGFPFPDLMKLDVQGYELEVLRGARECLQQTKALVLEVSFSEYYEGQCLFHDLVGFLTEFGLYVTALGAQTPTGIVLQQADALFVRRV